LQQFILAAGIRASVGLGYRRTAQQGADRQYQGQDSNHRLQESSGLTISWNFHFQVPAQIRIDTDRLQTRSWCSPDGSGFMIHPPA
jgi:hypothetical protein